MQLVDLESMNPKVNSSIQTWLTSYIEKPHRELGRSGAVCPFVETARLRGEVHRYGVRWPEDGTLGDMERLAHMAIRQFREESFGKVGRSLRALLIVIIGLPVEGRFLVDQAHSNYKEHAVAEGLMLGQFHPECAAPAAWNADFPVNRAPYPLFAVREIAFHDILFLHGNDACFEKYRQLFANHYSLPDRGNSHMRELYDSAMLRVR
jgi:heptaprenyl diphosphate synthase